MSPAALQQRPPLQQQNSSPQQKQQQQQVPQMNTWRMLAPAPAAAVTRVPRQQQGVVMQGRPGLSTQMSTPCSSRVWGMTSTSRT